MQPHAWNVHADRRARHQGDTKPGANQVEDREQFETRKAIPTLVENRNSFRMLSLLISARESMRVILALSSFWRPAPDFWLLIDGIATNRKLIRCTRPYFATHDSLEVFHEHDVTLLVVGLSVEEPTAVGRDS
jgi:hypothetical protein